jgi:hypothetical protein
MSFELSEDQRAIIKHNRIKAMKRRLSRFDYCTFDNVPNLIVEAFFGKCTYNKRIKVSTFGYLNGIMFDQIIEMQQWTDFTDSDKKKLKISWKLITSSLDIEENIIHMKFCVDWSAI